MSGNINGSVLSTVSLDGVTATVPLTPNGSVVAKAAPSVVNASKFSVAAGAVVYDNYAAVSGMWGATWGGAVVWTPSGTGSTGASYNIAAVTLANSLTGAEKIAVFWTAGGVAYRNYDGVISSLSGAGFTVTFPSGQTALPATGATVILATNIDADMTFNGNILQQLLITSTQPGLVNLMDGGSIVRRSSVIAAAGSYDGWPTAAGQTTPIAYTIAEARFYNNSIVNSVAYALALVG